MEASFGGFGAGKLDLTGAFRSDPLGTLCDALLLLCVIGTPFVMGGRSAAGQLVFQATAFSAATVFAVRQFVRREGFAWHAVDVLLAAGVAVVAFQLVPLPPGLHRQLSPYTETLLPLWGGEGGFLPAWNRISLAPAETLRQLGILTAGALLLFTARQRLTTETRLKIGLAAIATAGVAMAGLGLVQYLAGNGKYYFVYENPYVDTNNACKGAFTNGNHGGGFFVLCFPALLAFSAGWTKFAGFGSQGKAVTPAQVAGAVGACVVLVAALLSESRAAMVGVVLASGVTMFFLRRERPKFGAIVLAGAVLAGILVVALLGLGSRLEARVEKNIQELASVNVEEMDRGGSRRSIWSTTVDGIKQFPILGAGLGAHRDLYKHFWQGRLDASEYTHVENGPLQLTLETGAVGATIAALLILVVLISGAAALRRSDGPSRAVVAAAMGMLVFNLQHACSDFVWHVPGCMGLVLSAAAVLTTRPRQEAGEVLAERPRRLFTGVFGPASVLTTAAAVAALVLPTALNRSFAEPHWEEAIRLRLAQKTDDRVQRLVFEESRKASALNREDARALVESGVAWLWAFDLGQKRGKKLAREELHDTVRGGGFETSDQVAEWLGRDAVAGENLTLLKLARRDLRRALNLAPLHSRAYAMLTKVHMLDDPGQEADWPLFEQAIRLHPRSAMPHYHLGMQLLRANRSEEAIEHWKAAFNEDTRYQKKIILVLSRNMQAQVLLDLFEPDWRSIERIRDIYVLRKRTDDARHLSGILASHWEENASAEEPVQAVHFYYKSYCYRRDAGEVDEAERVARRVVAEYPNQFAARKLLADHFLFTNDWAEAAEQLEWCSQQRPGDEKLLRLAASAKRRSREQGTLKADGTDGAIFR